MFDKLIESEPEGADFRDRRRYFMVSSVVVGILFTTAVVISIYAADYGLGSTSFQLTELLAPVEMAAAEVETPRPRLPQTQAQAQSATPTRSSNMASVTEPTIVPNGVSTVRNTQMERPLTGNWSIDKLAGDTNPANAGGSGRETPGAGANGPSGLASSSSAPKKSDDVEPPPAKVELPPKTPPIQSLGVVNGRAEYLPKPDYPASAITLGIQGKVDIQVLIDETGKVISAKAVSGHILLKSAAEQSARRARFSPTYLSKIPVKVSGVITYNFTR